MALPFRTANNTRAEHLSDHNTLHAWYNNLVLGNFVADSIFISASGESTFDMDAAGAEWSTTGDMWLIADGTLSFTDSVGELTLNDIRNGLGGGGGGSGTGFTEAAPDQWVFMPTDPVAIAIVASNATTSSIVQISADASAGFITTADGSMSQVQALGVGSTAMLTAPTGTASVIGDDVNIDAVGLIDIDAGELSVVTPDGTLEMYGAGVVDLIAATTLNLTAGTGEVQFTDGLGTITLDEIRTDMAGGGGGGISGQGTGSNSTLVGDSAVASADQSTALGDFAVASSDGAIAIGGGTNAQSAAQATTSQGAIAIGVNDSGSTNGARATNSMAIAIGSGDVTAAGASATGAVAIAMGAGTTASNSGSVGIGNTATASGSRAIAIGTSSTASASFGVAVGRHSSANTGTEAIAIGGGTSSTAAPNATAQGAIAIGASAASGVAGARASGTCAVALGGGTSSRIGAVASANFGVAIGAGATASTTNGAIAIGASAGTSDSNAPLASGLHSIAMGGASSTIVGARASGANSIALGGGNTTLAGASATAADAIAIGRTSSAGHATAVALGAGATTTAANQIMLGTASETVVIPGAFMLGGNAVTTGAWIPYTPVVKFGATTATIANNNSRYTRLGRTIVMHVSLEISSLNGGTGNMTLTLPFAGASTTGINVYQLPIGFGGYGDGVSGEVFPGLVTFNNITDVVFRTTNAQPSVVFTHAVPNAVASTDEIHATITYEAAS